MCNSDMPGQLPSAAIGGHLCVEGGVGQQLALTDTESPSTDQPVLRQTLADYDRRWRTR